MVIFEMYFSRTLIACIFIFQRASPFLESTEYKKYYKFIKNVIYFRLKILLLLIILLSLLYTINNFIPKKNVTQ